MTFVEKWKSVKGFVWIFFLFSFPFDSLELRFGTTWITEDIIQIGNIVIRVDHQPADSFAEFENKTWTTCHITTMILTKNSHFCRPSHDL